MLYFIKLSENTGSWANPDEAKKYMEKGFEIYEDDSLKKRIRKIEFPKIENEKNKGYEVSTKEE